MRGSRCSAGGVFVVMCATNPNTRRKKNTGKKASRPAGRTDPLLPLSPLVSSQKARSRNTAAAAAAAAAAHQSKIRRKKN